VTTKRFSGWRRKAWCYRVLRRVGLADDQRLRTWIALDAKRDLRCLRYRADWGRITRFVVMVVWFAAWIVYGDFLPAVAMGAISAVMALTGLAPDDDILAENKRIRRAQGIARHHRQS